MGAAAQSLLLMCIVCEFAVQNGCIGWARTFPTPFPCLRNPRPGSAWCKQAPSQPTQAAAAQEQAASRQGFTRAPTQEEHSKMTIDCICLILSRICFQFWIVFLSISNRCSVPREVLIYMDEHLSHMGTVVEHWKFPSEVNDLASTSDEKMLFHTYMGQLCISSETQILVQNHIGPIIGRLVIAVHPPLIMRNYVGQWGRLGVTWEAIFSYLLPPLLPHLWL